MKTFLKLLPALLFSALFVSVGILHVTSRVLVVDAGYRLSLAESQLRKLGSDRDRLQVELALMKGPARLEELSRDSLQMGPPAAGTVMKLGRERLARKAGGK